jgi:hypothetical protein
MAAENHKKSIGKRQTPDMSYLEKPLRAPAGNGTCVRWVVHLHERNFMRMAADDRRAWSALAAAVTLAARLRECLHAL